MSKENNQNPILEAALSYAEKGLPVFPVYTVAEGTCTCTKGAQCSNPGKHPLLSNGVKGATTDQDKITQWWTQWPEANVAIATGEKSFDVLDVDIKDNGKSTLERLVVQNTDLPGTPCQKTGSGGAQYFFKYSGKIKNRVGFLPGLDTRSGGGYVVVPPSKHYSGGTYQWEPGKSLSDLPLADMPEWLVILINGPADGSENSIEEEIPEGKRNDVLFSLGCSLRAKGLDIEEIGPALKKVNERKCKPPLPDSEIETILKSVEKYPRGTASTPGPASNGKPEIDARCQDVQLISKEAWNALELENDPPWLFKQQGRIVHITADISGQHFLRELNEPRLRFFLARNANWYTMAGENKVPARPPYHVVEDMLADPDPTLPFLRSLVYHPFVSSKLDLVTKPGYSPDTSCYLCPGHSLEIPKIPQNPSSADVKQALGLIYEMLHDFPFTNPSERANAIALFLTPFVREVIQGPTPLHLIEAPSPGTGKTLLARVLSTPPLGRAVPSMTESRNEEEYRKKITSILRNYPPMVLIDNVKKIVSSQLSAALTNDWWEDRLLGKSETVRLPVRCVWVATGNNPELSSEIARRTVRIRLDAKIDRPWMRQAGSFTHSDIFGWVRARRGELVGAALTIAQAWIVAGCPADSIPKPIGGFEDYAKVIGGILRVAGVDGFLGNMHEFYESSDRETEILRSFVAAWWKDFQDHEVGVAQLYPLIEKYDIPLDLGNSGSERSLKTRFGRFIGSLRDRQIGSFRISAGGSKDRAQQYRLSPLVQPPATTSTQIYEPPDEALSNNDREGVGATVPEEKPFSYRQDNGEAVNPAAGKVLEATAQYSWMEALNEMQEQ